MLQQNSNPYPQPAPVQHKVWILDCRSCDLFLTNRAMKAVLLLRPNVSLYSSDASPVNCSAYSAEDTAEQSRPAPSRTCDCLTQTLCCHGCGNPVGYMIVVPVSPTAGPSTACVLTPPAVHTLHILSQLVEPRDERTPLRLPLERDRGDRTALHTQRTGCHTLRACAHGVQPISSCPRCSSAGQRQHLPLPPAPRAPIRPCTTPSRGLAPTLNPHTTPGVRHTPVSLSVPITALPHAPCVSTPPVRLRLPKRRRLLSPILRSVPV